MTVINNRYKITELLGEGGFGEVYKIEDLYEHNKVLALKKIRAKTLSKHTINIFKLEFKFLTSLTHPNLVKVYDFDVDKDTNELFFTMEYVKGESLFKNCKDKLSWNHVESYMVQAARAIAYIHSKGIIHYDIKPDNMLINEQGQLKLMDFGFAGTHEDSRVRGTIQFLAPEFILKRNITNRVDFFSLGVTFYYSISGKLPFTGKDKKEILFNTARGSVHPLNRSFLTSPPYLAAIIHTLLQKRAEQRFDSATEIIKALNHGRKERTYDHFVNEGIRGYFSSGRLIGRKGELELLTTSAFKIFRSGIFYDNKPVFMLGKAGNGKSSILREFRYHIQVKEDIDYFSATFITADDKPFQAFEIIIGEMVRLYNLNLSDYPGIQFLFAPKDKLDKVARDNLYRKNVKKNQADNINNFLISLSHKHKFVLELKSFNYANSASIDLISKITRSMRHNPEKEISFFVICTVQSEQLESYHKIFLRHEWEHIDALKIAPLDQPATSAYINDLLMLKKYPEAYATIIYNFTKGIPFYINELFVYMFRERIIDRKKGKWVQKSLSLEQLDHTPQQIAYANFKNLAEQEQLMLKGFHVIGRPVSFSMLKIFNKICQIDDDTIITEILATLCNRDVIQKIKYSDGFRYFITEKLLLRAIKEDFTDNEVKEINGLVAAYIEIHQGLNRDTIFTLSDYYYRSNDTHKLLQILPMAVNKAFQENDLKLASLNLERLYNIEEDREKKHNIFIAAIHTLENQGHYNGVLSRISKFYLENKKVRLSNLIDINLLKHRCALRLGDEQSLQETETWLLNSYKYKLVQRETMAKLLLWRGNYAENRAMHNKALKFYKKSGIIYKTMKKELQCAKSHVKTGRIYALSGKSNKALILLTDHSFY